MNRDEGPAVGENMGLRTLDVAGLVRIGRRVLGNLSEHRTATFAAALAYRGLFALFPFVLILVVLAGALGPPDALDRFIEEAKSRSSQQVPRQLQPVAEQGREQFQPLEEMVGEAEKRAGGGLLLFGIATALWSVSALASTLADALNIAYGETTPGHGWRTLALRLASGPFLALAVVVSAVLMVIGPQVVERVADTVGLRESFVVFWGWLRFPVALALLTVVISIIYRYGSVVRQRFRSVVVGAALAVSVWAITSVGFSVYLANFADYGATYGSLGAAVGLLLYLYVSASIVLAGAEVNAAIYHSAADGKPGTEEPGSARGISATLDGESGRGRAL